MASTVLMVELVVGFGCDVNDGHNGVVEASLNRLSYGTGGWSCCGIAMAGEVESL